MTRSSFTQPDARTALITGGGTGIGRAASVALASEGYEVTVAGRTAATLQDTVRLVTETGGTARYVIADVDDEDAVRHAVEVAAGEPAQLDVAVNSAGVDGGNDSHPFVGYPVQTLDLMLATNVRGMFFSMKHELEIMGSRRAQATRLERLIQAGLESEELDRLSAPVGLDLGASSPEETALSILAEVIAVRHGHQGGRLADTRGPIHATAP
jgi:NAD(P)-dependent dehydrogenase (short-subunit alcohol dehydrogenase family)